MGFYFESMITELLVLFVTINVFIVLFFFNSFQFWKRRGIPYVTPSFPFGNIGGFMTQRESMGENIKKIYDELKSKGEKYGGFYSFFSPTFIPVDPEIIKQIMIKDFAHFQDRGVFYNEKEDPLSAHMFALGGPKWRKLRVKLTPTFTSGKMKSMFHTLTACGQHLEEALDEKTRKGEPIDIKDIGARFTTDIISLCAFGLENFSLKDPENEFRKHGKMIFERGFTTKVKRAVSALIPSVGKLIGTTFTTEQVSTFFMNTIRDTVDYRENNNIVRNDMLNLLIKLKNNQKLDDGNDTNKNESNTDDSLTFNELAAQCFVFFIAGYETSSTTMTFALFELSQNQDIQDKVREEVRNVLAKHNGELTYEAVMEMTYTEKVINETLRKYPPLPILHRTCTIDWKIPGTNQVLPKGTQLNISNYGLHMDPEYYPEPEKFDPERFSEEEKAKRPQFTHLPFGDGPRNCIGLRFGMMQTKVGLATFLRNHTFKLDPKTVLPIYYDRNILIMSHKYGIWLQAERL